MQNSLQEEYKKYRDALNRLENPEEKSIMSFAKLDKRIAHNKTKMPCTEGETDMAKRYKAVMALANGASDFYDGWMKNPHSAMLSCNDGFRPVSFYVEVVE